MSVSISSETVAERLITMLNTPVRHTFRLPLIIGITYLAVLLSACDQAAPPEHSLQVGSPNISSGTLSAMGESALIGSSHQGGSFWSVPAQKRLYGWNHMQGERTPMAATDLSPDGNWGLTSDGETLVLWDAQSGSAEQYWSSPSKVLDLALGAEGTLAMLGLSNHRAVLYNVKQGGVVRRFAHDGPVTSVSLSADGNYALTGSEDGYAMLWDTHNGRAAAYRQYPMDVHLVRVSPSGKRALSASRYDGTHVWDTQSDESWPLPQNKERGLRTTAARFSDDGNYLLTGRVDGLVHLWDLEARSLMYTWRLPKRKALSPITPTVVDLAFTEDLTRYRALSSNGFVHELSY